MSSPIYELLKRPDELFVVEHAHLQPRFVEDSVRVALKETLESLPRARRRRLPPVAPGEPGDDPHPRRARRALRHGRRAARELDRGERPRASYEPPGVARRDDARPRNASTAARAPASATPWHVIVLNDNHNTFDGVAAALARVLPASPSTEGLALREPDPHDRPGGRLVRPPRGRRALLERAQAARPDVGPAGAVAPAQLGAVLRPGEQPADVRAVQHDDRRRRRAGECDHRPGVAEQHGDQRQRQPARRSTRATRSGTSRTTRIQTPAPIPPTIGATPRNAPPVVATIFPPRWKPMNSGRQWPSIAAAAGQHARQMPVHERRDAARARSPLPCRARSPAARTSGRRPARRSSPPMFPLPTVRMSACLNTRTIQ